VGNSSSFAAEWKAILLRISHLVSNGLTFPYAFLRKGYRPSWNYRSGRSNEPPDATCTGAAQLRKGRSCHS
jgi:hypothetical protein